MMVQAVEKDGLPVLLFADGSAFAAWLANDGFTAPGAWLMLAKKSAGAASLSRQDAIDAALCEGWIDGQTGRWDERFFVLRFTPRRPRGNWSEVNRARAEQLIAQGRMRERGMAQIEAARTDGRWAAAYPPSSRAGVPPDLQAALDDDPTAAARFAALSRTARYAVILGLSNARRAEARQRRIAAFITAEPALPDTPTRPPTTRPTTAGPWRHQENNHEDDR